MAAAKEKNTPRAVETKEKASSGKASSHKVENEFIRQLAGLLNETGLTEIEYEKDGLRVRVVKNNASMVNAQLPPPVSIAAPAAPAAPAAAPTAPVASEQSNHPGMVKSPMVGTVYMAPEPGAPNFISVGSSVSKGQTLLIIEAMKVMNPIAAPKAGVIKEILVQNAAPVEFDSGLVIIE